MDITGSQKIKAPRPQVFAALLNPDVLKESIPGCESAKLVDIAGSQQLKLRISPNIPGFKGSHAVFLPRQGKLFPFTCRLDSGANEFHGLNQGRLHSKPRGRCRRSRRHS